MRFANRTAVITGGAVGFGRAFARALAAEGASVVIADIDVETAERTAAQLHSAGGRAIAVSCDVADPAQVDAAVSAASGQFGGIDIVINNAGLHLTKYNQPFTALSRNEIRDLFDVNVMGVINVTLACRDSMRERGGGVVLNISSMAGYLSATPYAVSKLTVRGLTVAFATELAPDRIRVNAIAPGLMNTESALADLPTPLIDEFVHKRQLVHRLGTMDDVVSAVLFLCSDEASFITGETLKVSGGYPLGF
ncbi:short-chain dehydrogenase [Mycobacterium sp. ACS1612]|uniref:SDR family NAD(P)-dependent oxidoreductase n=1 Tax=Mycobacterium sp. ACS1612 TaxID=1834117 RepID=UPI000801CCA7|nr:SDR family oxidoreductase [Mycobacterium sp. ACS1612]OBF40601.1 short-chain dehydrogenase [Mycobacterium sp. ACS1612]